MMKNLNSLTEFIEIYSSYCCIVDSGINIKIYRFTFDSHTKQWSCMTEENNYISKVNEYPVN